MKKTNSTETIKSAKIKLLNAKTRYYILLSDQIVLQNTPSIRTIGLAQMSPSEYQEYRGCRVGGDGT